MKNEWEKEKLAQQLHEWYLEACQRPESGMDFNPAAQEPYEALKDTQKFLDRYIADKIIFLLVTREKQINEEFLNQKANQHDNEVRRQFKEELLKKLPEERRTKFYNRADYESVRGFNECLAQIKSLIETL